MNQTSLCLQTNALLDSVKNLLLTQQQTTQQEVTRLLKESKPHVESFKKDQKENALKFNVFSALGVVRKETIQSKFLAYLLEPKESHCQELMFLNAFLRKINVPEIASERIKHESNDISIRVSTEHFAGESLGRMDIVLACKPDLLIVIENKVDAGEAEQQLSRYANWLDRQQGYNYKKLIFLTPSGHESVTGKMVDYLQLSYLNLAEAFEPLLDQIQAEAVRVVFTQYINTCKHIGGVSVAKNQQLIDLLAKPENIGFALQIEQQTQFIRSQIAKNFGKHIQKFLQSKLDSAKISGWKVVLYFDDFEHNLKIEIKTLKHQEKRNYIMIANNVFFKIKVDSQFGWYSPQRIDRNSKEPGASDIIKLVDKMRNAGCMSFPSSFWLAYKNINDEKIGFVTTDIDDILKCLADNESTEQPLANKVAEVLWEMFITYYKDIEALDSFKQAASS